MNYSTLMHGDDDHPSRIMGLALFQRGKHDEYLRIGRAVVEVEEYAWRSCTLGSREVVIV